MATALITREFVRASRPSDKAYEIRDTKLTGLILRVNPSGRMNYVCQYGRGKRVNIGRADALTPSDAREKARQTIADYAKGIDPMEAKRKAKAHTLESYVAEVYGPWVEAHHGDGRGTIQRLETHFLPLFGELRLDELTAWHVEKWRSERLKAGVRPSTLNRDVGCLKATLGRAVDWNLIAENPLVKVKPLKTDSQASVRYLTDEEDARLRKALDKREKKIRSGRARANDWRRARGYDLLPGLATGFADYLKPMVVLSLNTGTRRGELFNLEWTDVDLDRSMVTVKGQGAKSGRTRHIPLNDDALNALRTWRPRGAGRLVFPGRDGKRLDNVSSAWRKLMVDAEIEGFRWHDMRHDFASKLVMAGVDLNTVRELLGHANIAMTLRYAHLAPAVKVAAVQKIARGETWQTKRPRKAATDASS